MHRDQSADTARRSCARRFPPEAIGKLPRVTCRACNDANGWPKHCDRHPIVACDTCHQRISEAHIHLDYVGHAAVTDRLLQADPAWSWAPAFHDVDAELLGKAIETGNPEIVRLVLDNSPPRLDRHGGMWIRLTVAGVTRLGYGDAQGKSGPNAAKETIGDALRNAAMRFGVGLDLWAKEDLTPKASTDDDAATEGGSPRRAERSSGPLADDPWATATPAPPAAATVPQDAVEQPAEQPAARRSTSEQPATAAQLKAVYAGFSAIGITDKTDALAELSAFAGRDIASSKELTKTEASKLISELKARAGTAGGAGR